LRDQDGIRAPFADCGGAAGCMSLDCSVLSCPAQYDACTKDLGDGGFACFAQGGYFECDIYDNCTPKIADGGAWGPTEEAAGIAAIADCTDYMLSLVTIAQINGQASVAESCAVTQCLPHTQ
jgi:hypothetical protein